MAPSYPELPYGGFHGFINELRRIAREEIGDTKLFDKLVKVKPSTSFGTDGLELTLDTFKFIRAHISSQLVIDLTRIEDDTSITVGQFLTAILHAKQVSVRRILNSQIQAVEKQS